LSARKATINGMAATLSGTLSVFPDTTHISSVFLFLFLFEYFFVRFLCSRCSVGDFFDRREEKPEERLENGGGENKAKMITYAHIEMAQCTDHIKTRQIKRSRR
jgi:hypothetical protein